jgi:hypothetical protein
MVELEPAHEMRIPVRSLSQAQQFDSKATHYGDIKHIWNPAKSEEVRLAKEAFEKAIKMGFRAFRLDPKDKTFGEAMSSFDPSAARIAFVMPQQGG